MGAAPLRFIKSTWLNNLDRLFCDHCFVVVLPVTVSEFFCNIFFAYCTVHSNIHSPSNFCLPSSISSSVSSSCHQSISSSCLPPILATSKTSSEPLISLTMFLLQNQARRHHLNVINVIRSLLGKTTWPNTSVRFITKRKIFSVSFAKKISN